MRRLLIVPLLLALAGCVPGSKLDNFTKAVTTTITNPVGDKNIYQAKLIYASALETTGKYRDHCWSKPYAVLLEEPLAICKNRRGIVRQMQSARLKASAAIRSAEKFVRDNPTLNASSAIGAAWTAVTDFQSLATRTAVTR